MAETTDLLINDILNGMMGILDDEQFKKLKNVLYIKLHDIEVVKQTYEIVPSSREDDILLENFEISLRIERKSNGTIKQYIRTVNKLKEFIGKRILDIDSMDIKKFIAYHQQVNGWKDNYLSTQVHYLSSFYNYLMKEEYIIKNPMAKIETISREKVIKKPFSRMELENLRNTCCNDIRELALIELLLSSGIRVEELTRLNWCDLDFNRMEFIVYGKGAKERTVFFNERASFHLQKYFKYRCEKEKISPDDMFLRPIFVAARRSPKTKDYERMCTNGVRSVLKEVGKKSGIRDVHPHKFRRTFATECYKKGMSVSEIQKLMGHNQIETTMLYITIDLTEINHSYRKVCA